MQSCKVEYYMSYNNYLNYHSLSSKIQNNNNKGFRCPMLLLYLFNVQNNCKTNSILYLIDNRKITICGIEIILLLLLKPMEITRTRPSCRLRHHNNLKAY